MDKGNYYDFEIELEDIIGNSAVEELFYLQDLKRRKLFLSTEVCDASVGDIVRHILQFNREDAGIPVEKRTPILLYITSPGGEVDAGFMLIDAIESSVTPVYTINLGHCYSMAFLISIAGTERYAMRNAKYLCHDGQSFIINSTSKVRDQMEFSEHSERRIKKFILDHTAISEELYDRNQRVEWYMFADEAKELGVVDAIIGVDCQLIDVI